MAVRPKAHAREGRPSAAPSCGGDIGFASGGGGDFMGMMGSSGMVAMLPQMMSLINTGGGRHGRRKKARH